MGIQARLTGSQCIPSLLALPLPPALAEAPALPRRHGAKGWEPVTTCTMSKGGLPGPYLHWTARNCDHKSAFNHVHFGPRVPLPLPPPAFLP